MRRILTPCFQATLFLTASSATLALAAPALAAGDAASAATPRQSELEEIVVTARRRTENLQDVPVSVTALSSETLRASGASDVRQLTVAVPSFNGGRNFSVLQPTIRGVGSTGVSIGDEANVALYVDGVYQPDPLGNITDLVEVEQVEVLRGPQGTLFGRNATGGLINIITPDPKFERHGRVQGTYGRFRQANDMDLRGYVTGGLTDKIAADLAVSYRRNDGYIDDLTTNTKFGRGQAVNARAKLLFQPSDKAKAVLSFSVVDQQDSGGNSTTPLDGNTIGNSVPGTLRADRPFQTALTFRPLIQVQTYNAALRTQFDLDAATLETTSSFLKDRIHQASDSDASPVIAGQNNFYLHNESVSQEVRLLSSRSKRLQWIVGGYAYNLVGHTVFYNFIGVGPTYTRANTVLLLPRARVTSFAGFGEGTYSITEALKLTLGARYTTEERTFRTTSNGVAPFPEQKINFNKWTYRATLQYAFNERSNVYATYSTGFKSGVFNTYSTSTTATRPETLAAYEVGVKSDPLPWLRVNLAAFKYDYKDLQVSARAPSTQYLLLNAARANIKGVDLELEYAVTPDLNIRFAGDLLDAKYASFPNAQVYVPIPLAGTDLFRGNTAVTKDVSGNYLLKAPKYTFSVTGAWKHDLAGGTLNLSSTVFRSGEVFYDFGNRLRQRPYTLLNGEIAWTTSDDSLRLAVFGRNLTNAKVLQQANSNSFTDQGTYERPTEIGVTIQDRF